MNRQEPRLSIRTLSLALACLAGCSQPLVRPGGLLELPNLLDRADGTSAARFSSNETANACFATAAELDRAGHEREAILLYEKARQHDPQLELATRRLAVLYDLAGETAKARAEFERALNSRAADAELWNDYGHFQLRHGDLPQAEKWLQKAIAAEPQGTRQRMNLAVLLARRGDTEASLAAFSELVGTAAAHSNVGVILAKQGRIPEAVQHLETALSMDPDIAPARAFLAYLTSEPAVSHNGRHPVSPPPASCSEGGICTVDKSS